MNHGIKTSKHITLLVQVQFRQIFFGDFPLLIYNQGWAVSLIQIYLISRYNYKKYQVTCIMMHLQLMYRVFIKKNLSTDTQYINMILKN